MSEKAGRSGSDGDPDVEDPVESATKRLQLELAQAQQELLKLKKLQAGTYYTLFNDLWKPVAKIFSEADTETFQRTKLPEFVAKSKGKTKNRPYLFTVQSAYENDTSIKDDQNSARSSHNSKPEKDHIWPCHVLENDPPQRISCPGAGTGTGTNIETEDDLLLSKDNIQKLRETHQPRLNSKAPDVDHPNYTEPESELKSDHVSQGMHVDDDDVDAPKVFGEIAHLVPASPLHASLYLYVAKWVFAIKTSGEKDDHHYTIQKMIHGCTRKSKNQKKDSKRLPCTGLKHFAANKIRLKGQKQHFDEHANVLIIPILSVQDVLNWNGNGYDALVLVGDKSRTKKLAKESVASVGMLEEGPTAQDDEIKTSRKLLEKVVLSLAEALRQLHQNKSYVFTKKHVKKITEIHTEFNNGMKKAMKNKKPEDPMVLVPERNKNAEDVKVRKVTFMDQSGYGHPAPDPLLLVVKAAINWSNFYDIPLLAAGEPVEEEDELSLLAEQQFLEMRDAFRKEQEEQEIIGMTVGEGTTS